MTTGIWSLTVETCVLLTSAYDQVSFHTDESCDHGGDPDLIYHEEAYRIACDIAGVDIDKTRWAEYRALMRQVFPDARIYSETNSEARKSIPRKASGIRLRYSQASISKPSGNTNIKKQSGKAAGKRASGAGKSSPSRAKKITRRAAG